MAVDYSKLLDGNSLKAIKSYVSSNYAAKSHTHTKSQITDFPSSMPASDVYAWAKASTKPSYTASEVGAVPTTRKVNNKALSADITLTASDVGAAASSHSHAFSAITSRGEAWLEWGGKNFSGSYGPIDAAMVPELGANRLAFLKVSNGTSIGASVEYSRDGGSTWTDYGATADQISNLFNGNGNGFTIGKATSGAGNIATNQYQLRVNIFTSTASIYTVLNKFVIYLSTSGTSQNWCTIRARLQSNVESSTDTWTVFANKVSVSGWSGYNVINTSGLTTYGNTKTSQYGQIQFIFGCDVGSTDTRYAGLNISKIFGFGGVGWTTPSTMAKTGHMYTYDANQNVVFPAQVRAVTLNENGTTLANKYLGKTATAADSSKLNGQAASYYLNYSNLSNKPIFFATYGTTTGEQIAAAITAGQYVCCIYNGNVYGNVMLHSGEARYYFSGLYGSYTRLVVRCSTTGATWTNNSAAFLGGFKVDGTSRVSSNAGEVFTINGNYNPSTNKLATASDIPTETTVSEWGFTKNTGTVTSVDSVSPSSGNVALSAVRYVSQSLTDTQKAQARTNIGAGTSNFTGYTSSNKLSTNYIQNDAGWTSNAGTITGVSVNGASVATSGVANITAIPWSIVSDHSTVVELQSFVDADAGRGILISGGNSGYNQCGTYIRHTSTSTSKNTLKLPSSDGTLATQEWVNGKGYITGITSSMVTTALGYTPGTSNLTIGTTSTTAAAGNHNHSGIYQPLNANLTALSNLALSTGTSGFVRLAKDSSGNITASFDSNTYSLSSHTHTASITQSGSSGTTLAHNTWYTLTAGGATVTFKTPADNNTNYYPIRSYTSGLQISSYSGSSNCQLYVPYANDAQAGVMTTGDQTFSGLKTFNNIKIWDDGSQTETGGEVETTFYPDNILIDDIDNQRSYTINFPVLENGEVATLATTDQIPDAAPNWWYYESSFTRSLNSGSSVQGTSLMKINSTAGGNEYAVTTSGSTISAVKIKVGDLIFTKYGEIGCVTSVPSAGGHAPGYVGYRVKWISGASWYCVEEGTLITMSDGSQRPIEEVKQGDSILGWDFENNKSCEAIALFANFTHRDDKTNFVVFSNGEYISGTEDHFIYSVDKGRDAPISELQEGEKCLDADGEIVEIYGIHRGIYQMGQKNFYHLVSSNNTYFANGVMNAAHPINKFNWMAYGANQEIPQEVMDILIQDAEEFRTYEFLVKNETFRKQSVNLMKEIKTRQNKITELKQFLEDTDYVTIKHSEGLPVDPEILEQRQNARDTINQLREEIDNNYQPAYNSLVIEYSPLGADTLLTNEERRAKYFKVANKRDNEALNIFKKYYQKDNKNNE